MAHALCLRDVNSQSIIQLANFDTIKFGYSRHMPPFLETKFLQKPDAALIAVDQDSKQGFYLQGRAPFDSMLHKTRSYSLAMTVKIDEEADFGCMPKSSSTRTIWADGQVSHN